MKPSAPDGGPPADREAALRPAAAKPPTPRTSSRLLLGEAGELVIEHEGRDYRLRITQNGKLILTA